MKSVALVTARVVDEDIDLPPLLDALARLSIDAQSECWDDQGVEWSKYALAILRSTWDYASHYTDFITWLRGIERKVAILNPVPVVLWNTDKHYLVELQERGLPVVPSTFFAGGAALRADSLPQVTGDIVVKPTVGAGGKDAGRHSSRDAAEAHLAELLRVGRGALVQPYISEIDDEGETGLVYFEGAFSHAFRKAPLLGRDARPSTATYLEEEITPRVPTREERAVADAVVNSVATELLYARVDLVRRVGNPPLILELELAEPSFFFETDPNSAQRFAQAIDRRLEMIASPVNTARKLTQFHRVKIDPPPGSHAHPASSLGTLPRSRSLSR